ncbi:hypothetical protein HOE39_01265 [Candidatus Woesearchaeota archaeon]|jgi:DNA polymerase II small subunit|nr:hypothetical protein [Candidatus Woesearchaeota archaeon]
MSNQKVIKELLDKGILPTSENIEKASQEEVVIVKPKIDDLRARLKIVKEFDYKQKKITPADFTEHYRERYKTLKNILFNRPEAATAVSIERAKQGFGNDDQIIIAMVSDINRMMTGTIKITVEDLSGQMDIIISSKNNDLIEESKFLTLDEVLIFKGRVMRDVMFLQEIILPDIPQQPIQYSPEEVYAVFSGDIHVGSKLFLPKQFGTFIDWLGGNVGNERQKEIAKKTKYFYIPGDLVDGVGIFPGQDKELAIGDLRGQYEELAKYLAKVPNDKQIIICPGNHDSGVRLEEPQPRMKDYAESILELPNVTMVTNPSYTNIHSMDKYKGQDVLMYHGYSFDRLIDQVEGLRLAGGYEKADEIHKFLLKRRHLSPTHNLNLTIPMKQDPHAITQVPDIMVSGHIHKANIGSYKNTVSISGSCWQSVTDFQLKFGHVPDPGMIPIMNLKTRKSNMLSFK